MAVDPLAGERVLAFDLETTGISTRSDRIVQIALLGTEADGSSVGIERLVDPRRPIPLASSRVHGIYDRDVRGAPTFADLADELHALIEGAVVVGHNVRRFDMALLTAEYMRLGRLPPRPKAVMDTLEVARRLKVGRPHNLGSLCARHGIRLVKAHTAGADALASLGLLWRMMERHPQPFRRSVDEIEHWMMHGEGRRDASELGRGLVDLEPFDADGRLRIDGDHLVLAFGRHRGRTVAEVAQDDAPYLRWLTSPAGGLSTEDHARLNERLQASGIGDW